ncbi:hypothetical protein ACH5RR_029152 [Cinchona calisaya]|uniref:FAD-binding PCMH-type domain-containing protein n=1 Tax=Cinchona calisaya TaxID=153742 RepID=A0ABD2YQU3_9GENT
MKLTKRMLQFAFLLLLSISCVLSSSQPEKPFIQCLLHQSDDPTISNIIYTPKNSSYSSILNFYIQNLRFTSPETPKPKLILTPVHESQIQAAIYCSKIHGLQIRIRSGGHDYEGSSYISEVPFLLLDMFNFRSISVDLESQSAWVGAGATIGETYYAIHKKNSSFSFAAGNRPTLGIGGHISGGGCGPLVREYGLAADNVIDARLIDVNGRILDRESMGEDLFWAIRGGMGANFGVILAYKIRLIEVPEKVIAFKVRRTLEQNATKLVHKWQFVAPKLPRRLIVLLKIDSVVSNDRSGGKTIQASFLSVFRGDADELLQVMEEYFPELGVMKEDLKEMSWIQYFAFYDDHPIEDIVQILTSRVSTSKSYLKAKSDFVQKPIPEEGIEKIWEKLFEEDPLAAQLQWTPFGGKMDEISESETPFPHRAGNSFIMFEAIFWNGTDSSLAQKHVNWIRELHDVIGQYVDKNPRGAYADYRDLDLGVNNVGETSVEQARVWGETYFKKNFDRLVYVKTRVDPDNFFKNEQSIPSRLAHFSS